MKRSVVKPDARSPYQRYGKRPHTYSTEYHQWADAERRGDRQRADDATAAHRRKFAHGR